MTSARPCYSAGVKDWTKDFFSAAGLSAWRRAQGADVTEAEVALLIEVLGLEEGSRRLLDVPCGDGRHAVALAKLGHRVTALDRASDNQMYAQQLSAAASVTIDFLLGDMRTLPEVGLFDGAYCWGNSFGYFPRPDMTRFVAAIAERLEPGARFVIDTA